MTPVEERIQWWIGHVVAGTLDTYAVVAGFTPEFLVTASPPMIIEISAAHAEAVVSSERDRRVATHTAELFLTGCTIAATVEDEPPHRFANLQLGPPSQLLDDPRIPDTTWTADGIDIPDKVRARFREAGLVGLVAAGFDIGGVGPTWTVSAGLRDVEAGEATSVGDHMLAGSISKLFTATAALQLVDDRRLGLDDPVNEHLTSVSVESDALTIRHLLTHTGGVSSDFEHFVAQAPSAVELMGHALALDFEPGSRRVYSTGDYAVLGQVVSDVVGADIVDVLRARIIDPLGLSETAFVRSWPDDVGPGYESENGVAVAVDRLVPSVPAAGGLRTTVADLCRFVQGWRSLLSDDLADQAIDEPKTRHVGKTQSLGWVGLGQSRNRLVGHAGDVLGFSSSLLWHLRDGRGSVLMTNRTGPAEPINLHLLTAGRS